MTAIVVSVIGLSTYSLFTILRHYGVAPIPALSAVSGLDLVALFAARISFKYARKGLSGSFTRFVVLAFAMLGSFIQTYHARIGNEPFGMLLFWASLPFAAVITYEIYIRWTGRNALIKAGHVFPTAKPAFGFYTWIRSPFKTLSGFDRIMERRREAIIVHHLARFDYAESQVRQSIPRPPVIPPPSNPRKQIASGSHSARITNIRIWAAREGYIKPGQTHGRLSRHVHNEYAKAVASGAA
jgi:hypothetical protein